MNVPIKKEPAPTPKAFEIRTESDVRAFVGLILDKNSRVLHVGKPFGDVVEVQCDLGRMRGAGELAPERTFSLFFPLTGSAASTFRERLLKKLLNGQGEKELTKLEPWETFREESDLSEDFGISGPIEAGNLTLYVFTTEPRSEGVQAAFAEIREKLKKGPRVQDWWDGAERLRATWLGPGVVAGLLALGALILGLMHSRDNVYNFGLAAGSGIPNLVMAGFFLTQAVLALFRRVAVTYAFLSITLAASITQGLLGAIFGQKFGWAFSSWVIALLTLFLLIWMPARGQDFHLFSLREFWRKVTFR